jgi:hypothetical protein
MPASRAQPSPLYHQAHKIAAERKRMLEAQG